MNTLLLTLFPYFPRRVGIPSFIIDSELRFFEYISKYNGTPMGCHTSIYDCSSHPIIDKLVFDFDGGRRGEKLRDAFDEVRNFVDMLKRNKYSYIPVFSGRKGFHVYVMLKPSELSVETAKPLLKFAHENLAGEYRYVDRHKFGVVNSMIRIPNTLNGKLYCTYLPLHFDELSIGEILRYATTPHIVEYKFNGSRYPLLTDIAEITLQEIHEGKRLEKLDSNHPKIPSVRLLRHLIRPCVFEEITKNPEPTHIARVSLVAELSHLGYTQREIFEIIRRLNWSDFDPEFTMYQIRNIVEKDLLPPSCNKLRRILKCYNCGWHYFWVE